MSAHAAKMMIGHELHLLHTAHPTLITVIMPESAWNGELLTGITHIAGLNSCIKEVIIGSFSQEKKDVCYNRLYLFTNDKLQDYYDKQHAVPLTERPLYCAYTFNTELFFKKSPPITPSIAPRKPLPLSVAQKLVPYICSELFCNNTPDDLGNAPILAIVNDWWFRMPHFQRIMVLAARFKAIAWSRPILYISFFYAQFFDIYGNAQTIATTPPNRFIR